MFVLAQAQTAGAVNEAGTWLGHNAWWLVGTAVLAVLLIFVWKLLESNTGRRRLQRDALEKLRKSLVLSARRNRGPAKTVWLSGGPAHPPVKVGRYRGHLATVEVVWICYKPHLFATPEVFAVNPVDLGSLDVPELQVRAIAVQVTRELGFAVPDVHDRVQRREWALALADHYVTPQSFAEAWKDYYSRAVDNAIAYFDALNAVEDRSFLRQEVTRSAKEVTETEVIPTKSPESPEPEASNRA
jgi:hypothetical protein